MLPLDPRNATKMGHILKYTQNEYHHQVSCLKKLSCTKQGVKNMSTVLKITLFPVKNAEGEMGDENLTKFADILQ